VIRWCSWGCRWSIRNREPHACPYARNVKNSAVAHAVMVIDMQRAFVEGPGAIPRIGTVLPAARRQIEAARAAGALVVYLQNDGGAGEPDQPETAGWELAFEPQPGDVVVRKRHDNGFAGTDLDTLLRDHHVKTISICGVMSEMCVAATARSAMERGYEVVLAHDAHGTFHVPALASGDPEVPAELAARAAEWSLGDGVLIPLTSESVRFRTAIPEDPRDDPT
jgi:nicotinamidase-related amidase